MLRSRMSVVQLINVFEGGVGAGTYCAANCDKGDDKLVVQARLIPGLSHVHPRCKVNAARKKKAR